MINIETIKGRITHATKTESEWIASSVILLAGEVGFASDTQVIKVGNGKDLWKNLKSYKGEKGDRGQTGPQGPQGQKGATGDRGLKGDRGDTGPRGPQGIQGPKGQDGVVTFESLSQSQKDSLKGEKGDRGPQGPRGIQGDAGANGDSAHTLVAYAWNECEYKNYRVTGNGKQLLHVYYDGKQLADNEYTVEKWWRQNKGNWNKINNQNKYEVYGLHERPGAETIETWFKPHYKGLTTDVIVKLVNVNDGKQGATGAQGPRGNQGIPGPRGANGSSINTWVGTEAQYNAISNKSNTTLYLIKG